MVTARFKQNPLSSFIWLEKVNRDNIWVQSGRKPSLEKRGQRMFISDGTVWSESLPSEFDNKTCAIMKLNLSTDGKDYIQLHQIPRLIADYRIRYSRDANYLYDNFLSIGRFMQSARVSLRPSHIKTSLVMKAYLPSLGDIFFQILHLSSLWEDAIFETVWRCSLGLLSEV